MTLMMMMTKFLASKLLIGGLVIYGLTACSSGSETAEESTDTVTTEPMATTEGEWQDLMSLDAWRNFKSESVSDAWKMEGDVLTFTGEGGGDLITRAEYDNFELEMDWKISEGGNSGLMFHVVEADTLDATYHTGPEYQLLDNERHADAKIEKHRAGDNYDLQKSTVETVKPAGEWNTTRLVVNEGKVEHHLNGEKVVEYELWTPEWEEMVANSKFAKFPAYGLTEERPHRATRPRRPGMVSQRPRASVVVRRKKPILSMGPSADGPLFFDVRTRDVGDDNSPSGRLLIGRLVLYGL